ncbi:MAG: carboxypeptidase-like regulatory domain-containing protein [Bacteroidetes bacterium]|nr:carboxypeptidase-like regulatory domain-containing protein [Bacteroidota bacterium]
MKRLFLFILLIPFFAVAQTKTATIKGIVTDDEDAPIANVSIQLLNADKGTKTDSLGNFSFKVSAKKYFAVVFTCVGYYKVQKSLSIAPDEVLNLKIKMKRDSKVLTGIEVKSDRDTRIPGVISIDPSKTLLNPSPNNSIESLLKFFVGTTSELTSNYNVRGGSYDENLIYVNDFEVYKQYKKKNGQQEGLSFINPELTSNVKFYVGGFQAKYGDKMSSALDITYKKPKAFGGSAYVGILEQGLHIEGISKNNKLTYLLGVRNRSNRNLLSSQQTKGNYIPSSSDVQAVLNYTIDSNWSVELFGNTSSTKFTLIPEESKLTTSVFTPVFSANLGLDIYFQGQEKDAYSTNFLGVAATHQPKKNVKLKYLFSVFNNKESENVDILGVYLFGERNFDKSQATFGLITNPLGAGAYQNFSRNNLDITVLSFQQKGNIDNKHHKIQWGIGVDQQKISDRINEWEYKDSGGYSLPYNPNALVLNNVVKGSNDVDITRFTGYIQDNIILKDTSKDFIINAGLRYNYNTLNNQLLISPRVGFSFKPKNWVKNVVIKASAGAYHQPPFYREMRRPNGTLNTNLLAQQSWQFSGGFDYNFSWHKRPARISTEAYYKSITDVVPYDIDNVRVRYFAENRAKAYAYGVETRLYAELVKDAESWLSIGFMRTKELINDFNFTSYFDSTGKEVLPSSPNIKSSEIKSVGWIRRPTDRMLTVGLFYQDYLSTNKNIKVYLSGIYGSNLPYNIPNSVRFRNALIIEPYLRVDMGFAALLLDGEKQKRSHSPFKHFQSIWASLELFNVVDRQNIISFLLIKDFQNNTFAIPNRLTPRMINLKLIARW